MRKFHVLPMTLALAATALSATVAQAFTLQANASGQVIQGWNAYTITFDYDYSKCPASMTGDVLSGVIDAAMNVWNSAPGSGVVLQRGTAITMDYSTATGVSSGRNPVIFCDPNFGSDGSSPPSPDVIPGYWQALAIDPSLFRPIFGMVVLNAQAGKAANIGTLSATTTTVVLAHELGHALGLGHSADPNALMYYASSRAQLNLAQDDVDGVDYLYPRLEPSNAKYFGCGTLAVVGAGKGSGSGRGGRGKIGDGDGDGGAGAAGELGLLLIVCLLCATAARHRVTRSAVPL